MNISYRVAILLAVCIPLAVVAGVQSGWEKHLKERLSEFQSCSNQTDDSSPCNRFVGRAMADVYGIEDFKDPSTGQYLSANEIDAYVVTHPETWASLGEASKQSVLDAASADAANGRAIIAVKPGEVHGHVAIILPGSQTDSANWHLKVPNSASFFLGKPQQSYVGDKLSKAFSSPDGVKIFGHEAN
jgi:hypothetical protein